MRDDHERDSARLFELLEEVGKLKDEALNSFVRNLEERGVAPLNYQHAEGGRKFTPVEEGWAITDMIR